MVSQDKEIFKIENLEEYKKWISEHSQQSYIQQSYINNFFIDF